jgi:hypothetical protein
MELLEINFKQNLSKKYCCESCDYYTDRKSNLVNHLGSAKHKNTVIGNNFKQKLSKKTYICDNCKNEYKTSSGLWKHKNNCYKSNDNTGIQITTELVIKLIEQNKELQQTLIEQNKTMMGLAEKAGNTISFNNNKTFNLNVFLNETCKDAINLTDFVNQIQISIKDLEETGTLGYAEGISKVFIKNLNDIDYNMRPIHCSDSKREILYIKDDNQWTKDDEQKTTLTKAIKQVAHKNIKQISEWQKLNPDFSDPDSKQNDRYQKIILNSMSGSTKEESDKNYEKIAKNICKEVVIDKT